MVDEFVYFGGDDVLDVVCVREGLFGLGCVDVDLDWGFVFGEYVVLEVWWDIEGEGI